MSVIEDNKGDLWMVTYEQGVWRYDGKTLIHYSVKDGSRDIKLFSIYKDKQGELWLGTHEAGAYKFNGNQFEKFTP
jgi:ligand-binding sensor domain-containing protein